MFCKGKVINRDKTHAPQLTINKTLTIIIITLQMDVVIKAAFSSYRWQEAIRSRHKKPSKDLLTGLLLLILKTY
ncbi:hypothetical protein F164LOC_16130 [Pectobacterium carotovorum]|nr:hypothetical protein F164LOC_16130 [Pectobacterium carotovorum]